MMSLQPKTIDYNGSCWIAISEYSKKASDVRRLTQKVASLTSRCKELESRLNDWENPSKESASSVQRGLARKQEAYENLKQRYDKAKQRLKDVGKKQQDFENKYAEEVKLRLKKERENKELNKKIEKLTLENMRLSGELKAVNELNDALKTKCDELLNSKMETESESNRKQIENDDLKNRLAKQKAQMSKDSSNSGLPTSKTPIGKNKRKPVVSSREKSDRKIGGQPGHPQHKLGKCIEGLITGTEFHVPEDFRDQLIEDGKMPDFLICPKCGTKLSEEDFLIRYKRSFYELASDAKVLPDSTGNYSVFDARNWYKIACINSRLWIDFLISFLSDLRDKTVKSPVIDSIPEENLATLSVYEKRMLGMFCISLWDKLDNNIYSPEMLHNLMELACSGQVLNEVLELLQINKNRIDFVDQDVLREQNIPLHLYCEYTRDQILSAFDDPKPQNVREGVKYYSGHKTDILLVTLNKSDRDYSPSTMYEDYSINENLFHWQSQSTTSSTSATGQRYINHARTNNTVLLFVREAKNNSMSKFTENYTFLGRVFYEYHTGSKPMSIVWRLEKPIPSKFIKKTSKMMVG